MSELIIAVLFGLGLAYFAIQNTMTVPISFGLYQFFNVPIYLIAFGSLLAGLLIAWVIHLVGALGFFISLQSKESKLREKDLQMADLKKRLQAIEEENSQLKGTAVVKEELSGTKPEHVSYDRPNVFQRIKDNWLDNRRLRRSY